jgi:hypothetical protein
MLTFYRTGRLFKNLTQNHLGVFCLTILLGFLALISSAEAQTGFHLNLEPQRVPWSQLSFHAKNFWVEVTTEIQIKYLRASELDAVLPATPQGIPIKPKKSQAAELDINTIIDPRFRSPVKIHNRTWFNPTDGSALGRLRLRRGEDDFKKMYRFTEQGVFRHRIEPNGKKEALQAPEKWTDIKDSFYPYERARLGCASVSERSLLIYILSAAAASKFDTPLTLCVFGKRQLHRVKLQKSGIHSIAVDYIEKTKKSVIQQKISIKALKIDIQARPIESDLKVAENFSFLGFHKDISIYINQTSHLPIQASGIIPTVGMTHLKLRECRTQSQTN